VWYNAKYAPAINSGTDGVCMLGENVDKWGRQLRIYLNDITNIPKYWSDNKKIESPRAYRADEFTYRINDSALVEELFEHGYRIGYNNP